MLDGRTDPVVFAILELEGKILEREAHITRDLLRVETLLHSIFFILNKKADHMTTEIETLKQDVADLGAASDTQTAAIVALTDVTTASVAALDDLAKKVADGIAGAADLVDLSNKIRDVKSKIADATAKALADVAALGDAVQRDDPPVVVPPVEPPVEPPVVEPPVETPPAV